MGINGISWSAAEFSHFRAGRYEFVLLLFTVSYPVDKSVTSESLLSERAGNG
jgi:hypothetical protein